MTRKSGAKDLTCRRADHSRKRLHERALPGPVWTDNGCETAGLELAGQAFKRVSFAIANGKIADRDPLLPPTSVTVGRAWVVTAVEIAIEGGLRLILERREPRAERLLKGCGGGPNQ